MKLYWKYRLRQLLLMGMQRTVGPEWTEGWAFQRGWLESREQGRWYMRLDAKDAGKV